MKHYLLAIGCLLSVPIISHGDDTTATSQYKALLDEFEEEGGARLFSKRFLTYAKNHREAPEAIDALAWVLQKVRGRTDSDTALQLLGEQHLKSKRLGDVCPHIANSRSAKAEALLRRIFEKSPHTTVKATAGVYLGLLLDAEDTIARQLKEKPELAPRVLEYYGKEYGKHLSSIDRGQLEKQREDVYAKLLKRFPTEKIQDTSIKEYASQRLYYLRNLAVGKVAPDIDGEDISGKQLKLSDYRGKIVMLTFWGHW